MLRGPCQRLESSLLAVRGDYVSGHPGLSSCKKKSQPHTQPFILYSRTLPGHPGGRGKWHSTGWNPPSHFLMATWYFYAASVQTILKCFPSHRTVFSNHFSQLDLWEPGNSLGSWEDGRAQLEKRSPSIYCSEVPPIKGWAAYAFLGGSQSQKCSLIS